MHWFCSCLARQHKSQFEQLIEAACKNRAGLKPAVQSAGDVRDEETKLDNGHDGQSSTSSVELIADGEVSDDKPLTVNELLTGNIRFRCYIQLSVSFITLGYGCCNAVASNTSKQLTIVTRSLCCTGLVTC